MIDRGQADFARPGWLCFCQRDVAPKNRPVRSPAQVQFELGIRCRFWNLIDSRDNGPPVFPGLRICVREFCLADSFSLRIEPKNSGENAAGWCGHLFGLEFSMKGVVLAGPYGRSAHPATVEHFAASACHPQLVISPLFFLL